MARPRTIDDERVLDALARAIGRVGPSRLTLADVAADAGLAPATLLQRFGSKRELLLALARRSAGSAVTTLRSARPVSDSPLEVLVEGLVALAAPVADPASFANHLAFLHVDLADPEFGRAARAESSAVRMELADLLEEAVRVGELRATDCGHLARTIQVVYNGALLTWALAREGDLEGWLRRELMAALAPYRRV
jgi:AcrR family transcriptional regulator